MASQLKKYTDNRGKHSNHFTGTRSSTPLVDLVCKNCKKRFQKRLCEYKVRKKISFCCYSCYLEYQYKNRKKCLICGEPVKDNRNKCCSKECSLKLRKQTRIGKKSGCWYEKGYKKIFDGSKQGKREHHIIAEQFLGRPLKNNEVVHHKNGKRDANRVTNLQVMTKGEHSHLHRIQEKKNGKKFFT